MKKIFLALALLAQPTIASANCVTTRIANLHPDRKDWIVTSGDMKPTLEPGDCVVAKLDFLAEEIEPGSIVVFRHPTSGKDWIKRVIALGRQEVQVLAGELLIDEIPVDRIEIDPYLQRMEYEGSSYPRCNRLTREGEICEIAQYEETLGQAKYRTLDVGSFPMDMTAAQRVPEGHIYVLGDNRDNSLDSRTPIEEGGVGFVPVSSVVGVLIYP